jgi:hypothetical protein
LFELGAWPTSAIVEDCAQKIWDWRFGEAYPLDFTNSSGHVQLVGFICIWKSILTPSQLNQKLCEIRNFLALSALVNLDIEFRLANEDLFDLSQEAVQVLRQEYTTELFADKQFIFGKWTIDENGVVWTFKSPLFS